MNKLLNKQASPSYFIMQSMANDLVFPPISSDKMREITP